MLAHAMASLLARRLRRSHERSPWMTRCPTLSDMSGLARLKHCLRSVARGIECIWDALSVADLVALLASPISHVALESRLSLIHGCLRVRALVELDVVAVVPACVQSRLPRSFIRFVGISCPKATSSLPAVEVSLGAIRVISDPVDLRRFKKV